MLCTLGANPGDATFVAQPVYCPCTVDLQFLRFSLFLINLASITYVFSANPDGSNPPPATKPKLPVSKNLISASHNSKSPTWAQMGTELLNRSGPIPL